MGLPREEEEIQVVSRLFSFFNASLWASEPLNCLKSRAPRRKVQAIQRPPRPQTAPKLGPKHTIVSSHQPTQAMSSCRFTGFSRHMPCRYYVSDPNAGSVSYAPRVLLQFCSKLRWGGGRGRGRREDTLFQPVLPYFTGDTAGQGPTRSLIGKRNTLL